MKNSISRVEKRELSPSVTASGNDDRCGLGCVGDQKPQQRPYVTGTIKRIPFSLGRVGIFVMDGLVAARSVKRPSIVTAIRRIIHSYSGVVIL